jgi:hypothetical protein
MPRPTTRITFEELQKLAAEVLGVDPRTVTAPWKNDLSIHIGAIWSAPVGPHVEYRSIEISLSRIRDVDGSEEDVHVYNVLFDILEGILRRRSGRRARLASEAAERAKSFTEEPTSSVRKIAPPFPPPYYTEPLPSEPPPDEDK